jgi:signal transduction histidine kinase
MSFSRLELSDLFDQLSFALCIVSKEYRIVKVNEYFQSHAICASFSSKPLEGSYLLEVFADSSDYLKAKIDQAFNGGVISFSSWEDKPHVLPFKPSRSAYGEADKMYQDLHIVPILSDEGTIDHVCLCVYDATTIASQDKQLHLVMEQLEAERKQRKRLKQQLEEVQGQLIRSEQMASIGQISSGIAYEITTPIDVVASNIQILNHHFQCLQAMLHEITEVITTNGQPNLIEAYQSVIKKNDVAHMMDAIQTLMDQSIAGSSHVTAVIKNLKEFSHVDGSQWRYESLEHCIESTLKIIKNDVKYQIAIERDYQDDVPDIFCQPLQINQVLLNLLVNASQAIDDKDGIIKISLNKIDANSVEIRVQDNGHGMEKALHEKIFEPFFTTKAATTGTGLGLSVSNEIIKSHQGKIHVNSEQGVGSEFIITLPIHKANISSAS